MKTFDELYYGYVVGELDSSCYVDSEGRLRDQNKWRQLFTKQGAVDFINGHPDSPNLIIESA